MQIYEGLFCNAEVFEGEAYLLSKNGDLRIPLDGEYVEFLEEGLIEDVFDDLADKDPGLVGKFLGTRGKVFFTRDFTIGDKIVGVC